MPQKREHAFELMEDSLAATGLENAIHCLDSSANLAADPEVSGRLSGDQLADCFATDLHQANLGVIWERLGI